MNYRGIKVNVTDTPTGWEAHLPNGSFLAAGRGNNPIPDIGMTIDLLVDEIVNDMKGQRLTDWDDTLTRIEVTYQVPKDLAQAALTELLRQI